MRMSLGFLAFGVIILIVVLLEGWSQEEGFYLQQFDPVPVQFGPQGSRVAEYLVHYPGLARIGSL